ncbi:hypothetical protein [Halarcobacter sp.]|uniref:hypothetical protein n=1 Tax=Halarcobacter sp. TaxID=2321133 RepID=UPI0029F4661A|nr:hypothetical protein [Halarcobacter sp.]
MELTPQTGDNKMDEAYQRMVAHISSFDEFPQFYDYFLKQLKTDNQELLNKWLLKVLFVELKRKHPFDEMIEMLETKEPVKAQTIKKQLEDNLNTVKARYGGNR